MNRRTMLGQLGAIGAVALAGCTGQANDDPDEGNGTPENDSGRGGGSDGSDGGDGDGSDGDGGDGEDTPTGEPESTAVRETSFEVVRRGPAGQGDETSDIEFDTEQNRIVVTGTIIGADGCKTAELENVSVDASRNGVTVAVGTTDGEGTEDEYCTQSLVAIEYECVVQFDGDVSRSASVTHDGTGVASVAYGESSASPPPTPRVDTTSFSVVDTGPTGEDGDEATVRFDSDDGSVGILGTIVGSDGCKTAALEDATYDADEDRLTVSVVTRNRSDAGGCTQALVGIEYESTVQFGGGLPGSVTITHDGETVGTPLRERSGSSGDAGGSDGSSAGSDA